MGFAIALLVVAVVSYLLIRVGAVALEYTGVSRDAARFQALSAFFGAGFTTHESEMVVNHPIRRRIIRDLIVIGNIGTLSLLSTVVLSVTSVDVSTPVGRRLLMTKLVVVFGGLAALWLVSRSGFATRAIERTVAYSLERTGMLRALDYEQLLRIHAGFTIAEVTLKPEDWLVGKTIGETKLRSHLGVNVLGIMNRSGEYIAAPDHDTRLHEGDTLVVYGGHKAIENARRKRDENAA